MTSGTNLPVAEGPCPVCGATQSTAAFEAPAQLVDLDQTFRFATCSSCGILYLRDRVAPSHVARLYDADYPLHRGPELWGPFAPLVARDVRDLDARRVAVLRAHREIRPTDTVVDLGCGRPTFLAALAGLTRCRGVGVDVVDVDVHGLSDRVTFVRAASERPIDAIDPNVRFSAVTMWHYLEHDTAPVATLEAVRDRLTDDGVVVIEVPDATGSTARWFGRRWPGLHTPRHASVFTPESLRMTAERAGLRVVAHTRTGTLRPFVLVGLAGLDVAGFRFGRHPASVVFPVWALGMALTWPWLGRADRPGMGLQTIVLKSRSR